jgi:hypothetical protein
VERKGPPKHLAPKPQRARPSWLPDREGVTAVILITLIVVFIVLVIAAVRPYFDNPQQALQPSGTSAQIIVPVGSSAAAADEELNSLLSATNVGDASPSLSALAPGGAPISTSAGASAASTLSLAVGT